MCIFCREAVLQAPKCPVSVTSYPTSPHDILSTPVFFSYASHQIAASKLRNHLPIIAYSLPPVWVSLHSSWPPRFPSARSCIYDVSARARILEITSAGRNSSCAKYRLQSAFIAKTTVPSSRCEASGDHFPPPLWLSLWVVRTSFGNLSGVMIANINLASRRENLSPARSPV